MANKNKKFSKNRKADAQGKSNKIVEATDKLRKLNDKLEADLNSQGKSNSGKQYGKKGSRPRNSSGVGGYSATDLDKIETNDVRYWNKTVGFNNVTKFKWDTILGYPRDASAIINPVASPVPDADMHPTRGVNLTEIMNIHFVPGPGYASDVNDGVNRGLAQLMAKIRSTLSTSNIGFETADLGIFLSATANIALNIGYAKRVLESMDVWNGRNMAYPRALASVQGDTWLNLTTHRNEYTARLNSLIDMYNNMSIPDLFDIYDRQYALVHNYFADEDSDYAQVYMFSPDGYYTYSDTEHKAVWNEGTLNRSFDEVLHIIRNQIQSWYRSSDLYQINGVLLRALKDAPRQVIPHYMGEAISPIVDRAFLLQIQNMTICGNLSNLDIRQDLETQDYIRWEPACNGNPVTRASAQVLRIFEDDVTQEDNAEMTRFLNFARKDPWTGNYHLLNCCSEIVTRVTGCWYNSTDDSVGMADVYSNIVFVPRNYGSAWTEVESDMARDAILAIRALSPFRYIPAMIVAEYDSGENQIAFSTFLNDTYNYTYFPYSDYAALQFQMYQSLWTPKISL